MFDFLTLHLGNNTYRASQFVIRLDGYVELDNFDEVLSDNPTLSSLFLHEYIHYLQDVTTRYGIMKAANIYGYTSQVAHVIRMSDQPTFSVPVRIQEGPNVDSLILKNYKCLQDYMGSGFEKRSLFKGHHLSVASHCLVTGTPDGSNPVRSLHVSLKDADDGKHLGTVVIGGEILSESMAYLVEQAQCQQYGIEPMDKEEYPYLIVQKLTERIYPELASEPKLLFSCIDACLYHTFNPGHAYYELLMYLKRNKFHNTADKQLITDFFKEHPYDIPMHICAAEAIRLLHHNFQIDELKPTVLWIQKIYERADFLRINPFFMDSFMGGSDTDLKFSDIVMQMMGRPLVQNDIYEAQFKLPSHMFDILTAYRLRPDCFSAIGSLLHVFRIKDAQCQLLEYCKTSKRYNKNLKITEVCKHPCDKLDELSRDRSDLCPFAFFWKHWGLKDKKPEL